MYVVLSLRKHIICIILCVVQNVSSWVILLCLKIYVIYVYKINYRQLFKKKIHSLYKYNVVYLNLHVKVDQLKVFIKTH